MLIDVNTVVLIGGFAITIMTYAFNRKADVESHTKESTKLSTKLDIQCNDTQEIKSMIKEVTHDIKVMRENQINHDARIEDHEKRITRIENQIDEEGK